MLPVFKYLFSAPQEDIPVRDHDLKMPFKISPSKEHPFLVLEDYFDAIKSFFLHDQAKPFIKVVNQQLGREIALDDIHEVLIRTEKHGAFCHIASVEVVSDNDSIRFAISTALSDKGRSFLSDEFDNLNKLNKIYDFFCLPRPYLKGEVKFLNGDGTEMFSMLLTEWFEDFHEWHVSIDEKDKTQKIRLWDLKRGYRFASQEESYEIFKQAARILTLYYNTRDFSQIYLWHHAAGDFIVQCRYGRVYLKLITVRGYGGPVMEFSSGESFNPMIAIFYFFLNLSIKIRLDRLDGVGNPAWAGDYSVEATAEGFFEALHFMKARGRYAPGHVEDLLSLLKTFSEDEFQKLHEPLMKLYRKNEPADFPLISSNLNRHIRKLHQVILRQS